MLDASGGGPSRNATAALLLTAAWALFTTELVAARVLAQDLAVVQITFVRLATQLVLLAPLLAVRGRAVLTTRRLPLHGLRAAASVAGMTLYYLAFALLPVAQATTLTFTQALWITLLAALLLGERLGRWRIGATLVGFLGVLVIARPGVGTIEPAMAIAVAGAFAGAMVMLLTRMLGRTESRLTIMSYVALFGTLLLAGPTWWAWQPIAAEHLPLLLVVGLFGTAGQFLMVRAFQLGEASALAPIDYVRLVFAVIAGYLLFGEVPDLWTAAGAAIIVGSAAYVTRREHHLARLNP